MGFGSGEGFTPGRNSVTGDFEIEDGDLSVDGNVEIEDGDLSVDGNVTIMQGDGVAFNINGYATVAAAGSSQGDATALIKYYNNVQGADNTKGVVLPMGADDGRSFIVWNASGGNTLEIYPHSGGTINGKSFNTPVTVSSGGEIVICVLVTTNTWVCMGKVS